MAPRTGRFRRADRLLLSREYQDVQRRGRRVAGREFVLVSAQRERATETTSRRLGISVSRRVGGAVVRNHIKRRVREWFRSTRGGPSTPTDLVVIARRGAAGLTGSEVSAALERLVGSSETARR